MVFKIFNSCQFYKGSKFSPFLRSVARIVLVAFTATTLIPAQSNAQSLPFLPNPGSMIKLTTSYTPVIMKGIIVNPKDPLKFDFLIDQGNALLSDAQLKEECLKLFKYFLASLTIPEKDMWVNLSPYERERVIPENFSFTDMGRDLLAQDYVLKQIAASLVYPEEELGKNFWDKLRQKAQDLYGTSEIPLNTFNKVWIVPKEAEVYVRGNSAFVVSSRMEVLLDKDYVALRNNVDEEKNIPAGSEDLYAQILKDTIIPEIEREVNKGQNFTALRQIYNAMILATWFKRNLKTNILNRIYVGQNKVDGIDIDDRNAREKIYEQYLEAFKKGVYDYIKEEYDPQTQEIVAKKYFSGGVELVPGVTSLNPAGAFPYVETTNPARGQLVQPQAPLIVRTGVDIPSLPALPVPERPQMAVELDVSAEDVSDSSNAPAVDLGLIEPSSSEVSKVIPKKKSFKDQFTRFLRCFTLVLAMFFSSLLIKPPATAASFHQNEQGQIVAVVEKGDTFGHIVKDMKIKYGQSNPEMLSGPLWGPNGVVHRVSQEIDFDTGSTLYRRQEINVSRAIASPTSSTQGGHYESEQSVSESHQRQAGVTEASVARAEARVTQLSQQVAQVQETLGDVERQLQGTQQALRAANDKAEKMAQKADEANAKLDQVARQAAETEERLRQIYEDAQRRFFEEAKQKLDDTLNVQPPAPEAEPPAGIVAAPQPEKLQPLFGGESTLGLISVFAGLFLSFSSLRRVWKQYQLSKNGPAETPSDEDDEASLEKVLRGIRSVYEEGLRQAIESDEQIVELVRRISERVKVSLLARGDLTQAEADKIVESNLIFPLRKYLEDFVLNNIDLSDLERALKPKMNAFFDADTSARARAAQELQRFLIEHMVPAVVRKFNEQAGRFEDIFDYRWQKAYEALTEAKIEEGKLVDRKTDEVVQSIQEEIVAIWKKEGLKFKPAETPKAFLRDDLQAPDQTQGQRLKLSPIWKEDATVMAATALISLSVGPMGWGTALATGLSPFIYRSGIVVSQWVHEMGHVARAGKKFISVKNLMANVSARDWAMMLIPFIGNIPDQNAFRTDIPNMTKEQDKRIRRFGFIVSVIFLLGILGRILFVGFATGWIFYAFYFPFAAGALWTVWSSFKTDIVDEQLGLTLRGQYACGLSSIIRPRLDVGPIATSLPVLSDGTIQTFRKVDRVVGMRGEHAGGRAVLARGPDGKIHILIVKVLNTKGNRVGELLATDMEAFLEQARKDGYEPLAWEVSIGHLRYQTQGGAALIETHVHQWMEERLVEQWVRDTNGRWMTQEVNLANAIGHNGDYDYMFFKYMWLSDQWVPNGTLGLWLERILHSPNETQGDSPKVAGMMDLYITQGIWADSARAAYYLDVAKSVGEVFGGEMPSKSAPNTAVSYQEWQNIAQVFKFIFEQEKDNLMFWVNADDVGDDAQKREQFQNLQIFQGKVREALRQTSLCAKWSTEDLEKFVAITTQNFFENDPATAMRKFFERTNHPANSFGLELMSTLKTDGIVLAARRQPVEIGIDRENTGAMIISSERAALKVPMDDGTVMTHRFSLDLRKEGEVVEINYLRGKENPLIVYSFDKVENGRKGAFLTDDEIEVRMVELQDNPYISPLQTSAYEDVEDPVRAEHRDIARTFQAIRDSFEEEGTVNSVSKDHLQMQLLQKEIETRIKQKCKAYGALAASISERSRAISAKWYPSAREALRAGASPDRTITERLAQSSLFSYFLRQITEGVYYRIFDQADLDRRISLRALEIAARQIDKGKAAVSDEVSIEEATELFAAQFNSEITAILDEEDRKVTAFMNQSHGFVVNRVFFALRMLKLRGEDSGSAEDIEKRMLQQLKIAFGKLVVEPGGPLKPKYKDVVLIGHAESLWVSEQAVKNFQRILPGLDIGSESANKVLVDPEAAGIGPNTICIYVSQSGQTFPTNNATTLDEESREKSDEAAKIIDGLQRLHHLSRGHVFIVTGEVDTVMTEAIGQSLKREAPFGGRVFTNMTGLRTVEAVSLTTDATYLTLGILSLKIAEGLRDIFWVRNPYHSQLEETDFEELRRIEESTFQDVERITAVSRTGDDLKDPDLEFDHLTDRAAVWGQAGLDAFYALLFNIVHVLLAVKFKFYVVPLLASLVPFALPTFVVVILQTAVFIFGGVLFIWILRAIEGRPVLARIDSRSMFILAPSFVHQPLGIYAEKLFGLAYGIVGFTFKSFRADDHALARGVDIWRGKKVLALAPDGRLQALQGASDAYKVTTGQYKGKRSFGVGADVLYIGRNRILNPNVADAQVAIKGDPATEEIHLQQLYEDLYDSLARMVAGQVFLWALREEVMGAGLPKPWRKYSPLRKRGVGTQDGTRVGTTKGPIGISGRKQKPPKLVVFKPSSTTQPPGQVAYLAMNNDTPGVQPQFLDPTDPMAKQRMARDAAYEHARLVEQGREAARVAGQDEDDLGGVTMDPRWLTLKEHIIQETNLIPYQEPVINPSQINRVVPVLFDLQKITPIYLRLLLGLEIDIDRNEQLSQLHIKEVEA